MRLTIPILASLMLVGFFGVGTGATEHPHYHVHIRILFDLAFEQQHPRPHDLLENRIVAVNEYLSQAQVHLHVAQVQRTDLTFETLCGFTASFLEGLLSLVETSEEILLGVSGAATDGTVLGCAYQDGYATGFPVGVVRDPAYHGPPLAAHPSISELHTQILYAHEVGHLLGGLHALAWPQGHVSGATGTLMYPTIQFNVPRLSGVLSDGQCIIQGNACRIALVVRSTQAGADLFGSDTPRIVNDYGLDQDWTRRP